MVIHYVSEDANVHPHHTNFINKLSSYLKLKTELVSNKSDWERINIGSDWLVSSAKHFLMPNSIKKYWQKSDKDEMGRGPHLVFPDQELPKDINNILLAYSSYPNVEQSFLRIGMDLALRFKSNLHCLKIVKPPQFYWSKRQYPITKDHNCYENIRTHESISQGVLEYAAEHEIDLVCILTRPWSKDEFDLSNSHSYKIIVRANVPILLFREDDVEKKTWRMGA